MLNTILSIDMPQNAMTNFLSVLINYDNYWILLCSLQEILISCHNESSVISYQIIIVVDVSCKNLVSSESQ